MEQLQDLLDQLRKLNLRAKTPIPANNGTTTQGHVARKHSAGLRIPEVQKEYRRVLLKTLVPYLITGSNAEAFVEAAKEHGAFAVDGEALYKELTKRLPKETYNGRMATKSIVDILSRHFEDIANENDVVEYPQIFYKQSKGLSVKNKEDLTKLIKKVINSTVGPDMALIYNLDEISKAAIEDEFAKEKLTTLIYVKDESIVDELLEGYNRTVGRSFLVTAGDVSDSVKTKALLKADQLDSENVLATLKAISANTKSQGE